MTDLNKITVRKEDVVMRACQACGTTTAHIGAEGFGCLQCVVDGSYDKENFKGWSRWEDKDGNAIQEPRGYKSQPPED